jgi:hypothetical protein
VDFGYRIKLERDRYLYPVVVQHTNPREGERCCRVTISYHGPRSIALHDVRVELVAARLFRLDPPMGSCTLFDGQSKHLLVVERLFALEDVTGFVVVTDGRNLVKHMRWFLRFQHKNTFARPWLFNILQRLTGVPHLARASDMNPKRCPRCRAGRRHIRIIDDSLVETDRPHVFHRSRRFACGKCPHEWSADSVEPEYIPPQRDEPPPPPPVEAAPM